MAAFAISASLGRVDVLPSSTSSAPLLRQPPSLRQAIPSSLAPKASAAAALVATSIVATVTRRQRRKHRALVLRRQSAQDTPDNGWLDSLLSGPRGPRPVSLDKQMRKAAKATAEDKRPDADRSSTNQSKAWDSVLGGPRKGPRLEQMRKVDKEATEDKPKPKSVGRQMSLEQTLFGEDNRKQTFGEKLDDEVEEARRKGEEELKAFEEELTARKDEQQTEATEEDNRLAELERQQVKLREAVARKNKAKAERAKERLLQQRIAAGAAERPATPPAPWRCVLDTDSSRWYYFNQETRVTSWEAPAPPPPPLPRPDEPLAPWSLVLHTATGRWYYHNVESGNTAWDPPKPPAPPPPPPPPPPPTATRRRSRSTSSKPTGSRRQSKRSPSLG